MNIPSPFFEVQYPSAILISLHYLSSAGDIVAY